MLLSGQEPGDFVEEIPEPYWTFSLFGVHFKPRCLKCIRTFSNREEWESHYMLLHSTAAYQSKRLAILNFIRSNNLNHLVYTWDGVTFTLAELLSTFSDMVLAKKYGRV